MTKLTPGSFLYNILYGKNDNTIEKKPFYVQNKKDYLESLERNCKEMGIPFKKPYVEEMPPYEKVDDSIETHIEYLDQIVVNLNVLKSGKVRVKILPQMAVLNEKYYSKYKIPPIKSITSTLKSIGYSQEFIDSMMVKYKKRNELIEKKWKILEKRFDAPSTASRNKKKKADKKAGTRTRKRKTLTMKIQKKKIKKMMNLRKTRQLLLMMKVTKKKSLKMITCQMEAMNKT